MDIDENWVISKAKEGASLNFIKTLLELSGYQVMPYGIENHNQEIVTQLSKNYTFYTNRRLLSMPDLVVIDEETKESWLVEVKYRSFKEDFDTKNKDIAFKYNGLLPYIHYWNDTIIIIVFNVSPYCLCVDCSRIKTETHFKDKMKGPNGHSFELWNFNDIYETITTKFPKVTEENFQRTLGLLKAEMQKA